MYWLTIGMYSGSLLGWCGSQFGCGGSLSRYTVVALCWDKVANCRVVLTVLIVAMYSRSHRIWPVYFNKFHPPPLSEQSLLQLFWKACVSGGTVENLDYSNKQMKAVLVVGSKEATFTPSTLQFLVKSMPRRLLEVIEKAGNYTTYTRKRTCSHSQPCHCWYVVAQCL